MKMQESRNVVISYISSNTVNLDCGYQSRNTVLRKSRSCITHSPTSTNEQILGQIAKVAHRPSGLHSFTTWYLRSTQSRRHYMAILALTQQCLRESSSQ